MRCRTVCALFARASKTPAMSRARTWQSYTALPRTRSIDCRRWRPNCHRQVGVIVTPVGTATVAAKAATTTIPTVSVAGDAPVKLGLVASLARQSANLTGINLFTAELTAKRLELLRELVPRAARVAVFVSPADRPITESTLRDAEA